MHCISKTGPLVQAGYLQPADNIENDEIWDGAMSWTRK